MALPHTSAPSPLARGTHDRLTPADLAIDDRSRRLWLALTGDDGDDLSRRLMHTPVIHIVYRLRREHHRSCPLARIGELAAWLAYAGWTEAELRQLPRFVDEVVDELFAGAAAPSLDDVDLAEQEIEGTENNLSFLRRIRQTQGVACTPEQLRHEAEVNRREASLCATRVRLLEREARLRESGLLRQEVA